MFIMAGFYSLSFASKYARGRRELLLKCVCGGATNNGLHYKSPLPSSISSASALISGITRDLEIRSKTKYKSFKKKIFIIPKKTDCPSK